MSFLGAMFKIVNELNAFSLKDTREKALNGDVREQFLLGTSYLDGQGVDKLHVPEFRALLQGLRHVVQRVLHAGKIASPEQFRTVRRSFRAKLSNFARQTQVKNEPAKRQSAAP